MRITRLAAILLLSLVPPAAMGAVHTLERDDQELRVEIHPQLVGREQIVLSWVDQVAASLAMVFDRWPRDRWRVEVRASRGWGWGGSGSPVPWGQVDRGPEDRVLLVIDPEADRGRLVQDWTAYHEFSHLLIPYRGWGDMWFSEGLATYYQNILQTRVGLLDERAFWSKLQRGFERGETNRRPDMALSELSEKMRESNSFMRVYWSGTWYWLKADVELRRRTDNRLGLDGALQRLNRCCADRSWPARRIAQELDRLTGETVFLTLFDEVSASQALPPWRELLAELGIAVEDSALVFSDRGRELREGIRKGPESSS